MFTAFRYLCNQKKIKNEANAQELRVKACGCFYSVIVHVKYSLFNRTLKANFYIADRKEREV